MLLTILYIIGITAEAMTGALAAGRKKMDIFGVIIIASVTAIGGGSLRDILLGHYPLTWVKHPIYIIIICSAAIITVIIAPLMKHLRRIFLILDAIGLITFSVLGAQIALSMDYGIIIACVAAVITGAFGGVLRDTLCNTLPLVFQKEIYASISLITGLVYVSLQDIGVNHDLTLIAAFVLGLSARLCVIRYGWQLPIFNYNSED